MRSVFKKILPIIIFGALFLVIPSKTFALSPGLSPFGGKIIYIWPCNCSGNLLIAYRRVLSSMPEYLSIRFSTKIYQYAAIKPGSEILGTTISPDKCVWGGDCQHSEDTELIGIVGTSH